jgi:Bacterial Ig-like domain (group 3)
VTFTATVTSASGTPTGTVSFYDGGSCSSPGTTLASTVAVNGSGTASFSIATLSAGTHTILACYIPSGIYQASSGSVVETIGQATNSPLGPVGPDVGGAAINPTSALVKGIAADYIITPSPGAWSITPLSVTITGGSYSGIYDGSANSPSACVSSYAGVTCTNNPGSVGPDVGGAAVAPVATVVTGIAADYTITPSSGAWSIAKAPVTAKAGSLSGVYNGMLQSPSACAVTGTYTGTLTCSDSPTSVGPGVGSGTVMPSVIGDTTNFSVTPVNGTWSIAKAPVTATAGSFSGVYN